MIMFELVLTNGDSIVLNLINIVYFKAFSEPNVTKVYTTSSFDPLYVAMNYEEFKKTVYSKVRIKI